MLDSPGSDCPALGLRCVAKNRPLRLTCDPTASGCTMSAWLQPQWPEALHWGPLGTGSCCDRRNPMRNAWECMTLGPYTRLTWRPSRQLQADAQVGRHPQPIEARPRHKPPNSPDSQLHLSLTCSCRSAGLAVADQTGGWARIRAERRAHLVHEPEGSGLHVVRVHGVLPDHGALCGEAGIAEPCMPDADNLH